MRMTVRKLFFGSPSWFSGGSHSAPARKVAGIGQLPQAGRARKVFAAELTTNWPR
jgi:hypothetical protein